MKERLNNQIFVDKENYQDEYRFDICRTIEELNKLPFDFYVNGGVICQFFFKGHSRYVNDIDIVTKCDLKEVESIFRKHFNVVKFIISPISEPFFAETFMALIEIDGKTSQIDGTKVGFFDEIKPEIYKVNDISFKGVPIEYLAAMKILAVISEVTRPFKHLVDTYTISSIEDSLINKEQIKKYMVIFNDNENKVRKMLNEPKHCLNFSIKEDKTFSGSEILATLQAGYNVSKETMIEEINKWLLSF